MSKFTITIEFPGVDPYKTAKALILTDVLRAVLDELDRAEQLWQKWPADPIHQAAIVAEEAGELVQAALQFEYDYEKGTLDEIRKEATQTAAMAIRLLKNINQPTISHEIK